MKQPVANTSFTAETRPVEMASVQREHATGLWSVLFPADNEIKLIYNS
jgi:hypothetical protein